MLCPKCNGKSEVADSRPYQSTIRRKRNCLKCKYSYRTLELLEPQEPPKPKLEPKPKTRKRMLKPRTKNNKVWEQLEAVRTLTDEELEEAIMTGQVRFDEDEL